MRIPRPLDPVEIRVLGSLLEKEQTTPDYYPMTVNSLIAACNQKTNRHPVTQITEEEVWDALERLRREVLVWRSEGARSERWSQSISRRLELDRASKAVLTLLMLRGPQTTGELRSRSERMATFETLEDVDKTLAGMAEGTEPLVVELPRRPGQKETRWAHLLAGPVEWEEEALETSPATTSTGPSLGQRVAELEEQVQNLTEELAELRRRLEAASA